MGAWRTTAIAAALVVVTTLSACGTTADTPAPATAQPSIDFMPMASTLATAVMHTRGLATADVVITRRITVAGTDRELSGVGSIDVGRGFGNILWTDGDGHTYREIVNNIAIFTQSEVPGGRWTRLPEGEATSTSKLADPLAGLGGSASLIEVGPEALDGVPTTRYRGQISTDPAALSAMGLSDAEIAEIDDAWQGASTDVTTWVDDSGRVVRVDRSIDVTTPGGSTTSVQSSTTLTDFSGDIDILSPPSASVTTASAGA